MIALCIIMAVLLIIVIILLVPVGAEAEYDEAGATLWLRIGAFRKILYPRPPKPEKAEKDKKTKAKKEKKEKKQKNEAEGKTRKGGTLKLIRELIPVGIEALGRFKRRLIIKKLSLYFCFGGEDPAKVALSFGGASAGAGMIVPLLQQHFRIMEMDIRNSVDFTCGETKVYAHADLRIRIVTILAIAITAGIKTLKIFTARKKGAEADKAKAKAEKGR